MGAVAEGVVEHLEYQVDVAHHAAFLEAFAEAGDLYLAARGCLSVDLTRGGVSTSEYRARIEWRRASERATFAASDAALAASKALAAFERRAHHVDTPVALSRRALELDTLALRRAFGHYPTGVAAITALGPGGPIAMLVSSFATVSLRPALVSFCAAHTSGTWPLIADARACCINVLAASQEELSRKLSSSRPEERFESVSWSAAPSGAPVLAGVVGWLDCHIREVRVAGDHELVLLDVLAHDASPEREPLLFAEQGAG